MTLTLWWWCHYATCIMQYCVLFWK